MKLVLRIVALTAAFTAGVYALARAGEWRPSTACGEAHSFERSALIGTYACGDQALELGADGNFSRQVWRDSDSAYGCLMELEVMARGMWELRGTTLVLVSDRELGVVALDGAPALCERLGSRRRLWARD